MAASEAPPRAAGLSRALGLGEVTAGGVGIIIGAGIYVLIGAATAEAGAAVWLAFVLAGLLSLLTGLSYAELSSMFPHSSAEYEYTRQVFPRTIAFVTGWVMIAGLVVAAAAVSLGFARYLQGLALVPLRLGAALILGAVTLVGVTGIKSSARLTVVLSLVQVGGLLATIAIGVPHLGEVDLLDAPNGFAGIFGAAALVFFAFIGFDEVITLAGETRNPARTVPRALLLALGLSTALYIGVAVAAVSVLGAQTLGSSERPLADVFAHVIGDSASQVVAVIAMISTTNTTLLALTAASRLTFGMAELQALPPWLAWVNRRQAPHMAILVCAAGALAFMLIGDLTLIASITDVSVYVVFLAVNLTVLLLRRSRPDAPRPFRVPWSVRGVPVLPVLGLISVLLMMVNLELVALAIGLGVMLAGFVAALAIGRRAKGK